MSLANVDALQRLSLGSSAAGDEAEPVLVVVADRIPQPSRVWLGEHDVSWLDLRGHLRLVAQGFFIDADVTPQRERPTRSSALTRTTAQSARRWGWSGSRSRALAVGR